MSLEPGQIVDGKYRIARMIGEGGMGAVYEGENTLIRRKVAIKVLNAGSALNSDAIRRFEREAQAAGQIGSDHILEVLDLGTLPNGDRYMVMEYLDGETLGARILRLGRLTSFQVAPLAQQFLKALSSAHAAGIIHRDLKPENIFILREKAGRTDFVKLIDFGISKFSMMDNDPNSMSQTRVGAVMGTPCYMSPEQARGIGETDVRSDVYAVGVILYEAVTGRVPFDGETFNDLMFKIALSDAPPAVQFAPDLDPAFAQIIHTAMARDPAHRFQCVDDLVQVLDRWMGEAGLLGGSSGEWTQPNLRASAGQSQTGRGSGSLPGVEAKAMVFHATVTEGSFAQASAASQASQASQTGTASGTKRRTMVVLASALVGIAAVGIIAAVALRPSSGSAASMPPSRPEPVVTTPALPSAVVANPVIPSASETAVAPGPVAIGAVPGSTTSTTSPAINPPPIVKGPKTFQIRPAGPASAKPKNGNAPDFGY